MWRCKDGWLECASDCFFFFFFSNNVIMVVAAVRRAGRGPPHLYKNAELGGVTLAYRTRSIECDGCQGGVFVCVCVCRC